MAPSSSSTKKAAKLAKSGQGKKVRFQGGTTFPLIVAIIVVLGLALVVYARQSRPAADASEPTIDDHWHQAYGFYLCDTWVQLAGNKEASTDPGFDEFARTGIHSHDDGVIHWHPATSASVGRNAKLSVFLDVYGVELSDDKLVFPEDQRSLLPEAFREDGTFEEDETKCTIDGEEQDAELKVIVWDNFSDTDDGTTYVADFDNIAVNQDAMVFSIAFVPTDTEVGMPPWAQNLPDLASADNGQVLPNDSTVTTIAGETTLPGATTVPPETVAPAAPIGATTDTAPATTDASAATTVPATTPVTTGG
ncbi:MAG: hypothetical protein ABWZ42_04290 [Ilumatobacteraceae bacterium]